MRTLVISISGFILLLLASCSMDSEGITDEDHEIGGGHDFVETAIRIAITDRKLQDCLNPESPAYFGQVYIEGIKLLLPHNDRKIRISVSPPFREFFDNVLMDTLLINQNTFGYYFIGFSAERSDEDNITYTYIPYPDGQEDEIMVQVFYQAYEKGGSHTTLRKIRINNEPVYAMPEDGEQAYYNPDYYPWTGPAFDRDGNQIGSLVWPEQGSRLIVIRK